MFSSIASIPALGPSQPPFHWLLATLFTEMKLPKNEDDDSRLSGARVK
jgi:hypothetical protein